MIIRSVNSIFAQSMGLVHNSAFRELEVLVTTLTLEEKTAVILICDDLCDRFPAGDLEPATLRDAMNGVLGIKRPQGFPALRENLSGPDNTNGKSVDVLFKLKGWRMIAVGHYFHELGKWGLLSNDAELFDGDLIEEWWPLPIIGTGTIPFKF